MLNAMEKIQRAKENQSLALDLSGMGLVSLPPQLWQLTALEKLDVYSNQLTALPEAIGRLSDLQELRIYGAKLTGLPSSSARLRIYT